jgi:FtsH-binding integral membrane protein
MWGLLGTSLVAALTGSSLLEMVECLAGVVLFAGATAHDVHKAIESYERGQPDRIPHSSLLSLSPSHYENHLRRLFFFATREFYIPFNLSLFFSFFFF